MRNLEEIKFLNGNPDIQIIQKKYNDKIEAVGAELKKQQEKLDEINNKIDNNKKSIDRIENLRETVKEKSNHYVYSIWKK